MSSNNMSPAASNGNGHRQNSPSSSTAALTPQLLARETLAELDLLFKPNDAVQLSAIDDTGRHDFTFVVSDLAGRASALAFLQRYFAKAHVYFVPNPVDPALVGTADSATDVLVPLQLWVFFDHDVPDGCSDVPAWQQFTINRHAPYGPHHIYDSGSGGLHVYYAVKGEPPDRRLTKLINAACKAVGSDPMGNRAHLGRPLGTLNVPTDKKRARGRKPGLVRRVSLPTEVAPKVWDARALCSKIIEDHGGEPLRKRSRTAPSAPTAAHGAPDPAPSIAALREVLAAIPNDDAPANDRQHWVDVAHGLKGASIGTPFEAEARDLLLAWSASHPKNDPAENEQLWASIHSPREGFSWLLGVVLALRDPTAAAVLKRKYGLLDDETLSVAEEALARLKKGGWTFFHAPDRTAYAAHSGSVLNLSGAQAWNEISAFLHRTGKVPSQGGKSGLRDLMIAEGLNGPCETVSHRVASATGSRMGWINLMDNDKNAVEWSPLGWNIVPKASVLVRLADRAGGLALPRPVCPNDGVSLLKRLRRYAPLPPVAKRIPSDRGVRAEAGLLMVLVSQFLCDGTMPHAAIVGPKGSAKTSTCKRLKDLTDPDLVEASQSLPKAAGDLYAIVSEQRSVAFDNITKIEDEMADVLCALASGTGYQARTLYTNFDRSVLTAKASVFMNSTRVDFLNRRPDLVDRTVIVELDPMTPRARRSERELNASWLVDRPLIFGQLLDALVGALAHEPEVSATVGRRNPPRLRDAAILAECAARALGWRKWLCLDALVSAWKGANERALTQDPVAAGIRELVPVGQRWTGTTADLLAALVAQSNSANAPGWGPSLPNTPRGLTSAVQEIRGQLLDAFGIEIERGKSTNRGEEWVITRPKV